MLRDWMDRVRGGQLMIAELQPMLVIEFGIPSKQSCESMRVGVMRNP
jgi:hypothetical protein